MSPSYRRFSRTLIIVSVAIAASWAGLVRANAPTGRYTISNGTVTDTQTKLTWEQNVSTTMRSLADAKTYCADLTLDASSWRLPTMKELQTIVDRTQLNPAIDKTAFPDTAGTFFWTSSDLKASPTDAWFVNFINGETGTGLATNLQFVRCVRK